MRKKRKNRSCCEVFYVGTIFFIYQNYFPTYIKLLTTRSVDYFDKLADLADPAPCQCTLRYTRPQAVASTVFCLSG